MKFVKILCVMAVALCLTASVYAETQSVKVSGDLTMRGIARDQYDLRGSAVESSATGPDSQNQTWFMTVAEVEVDANLTDNVSTVIRVLNQRDWNVYTKAATGTASLEPNGRGIYTANDNEFNVMLDLAYVELKNFIYSPLTLTIGRQDLWFGKGFIVGANQQNPGNGPLSPNLIGTTGGNLSAPEYTAINSFDSVKAVFDYDPWTITGIYSKIYEDAIQARDDVNLWGVNVGYKFDSYKAEAEGYWFWKQDRSVPIWNNLKSSANDIHTFGLRGSFDPIDIVTIAAEGAYQGGSYVGTQEQQGTRQRSAWALDVSGELRYFTDKCAWKPKLGVEYILYSGATPSDADGYGQDFTQPDKLYTGWDPMYRGKYDSAIREFVGKFYQTFAYPAAGGGIQSCPDDSRTNQSQLIFSGSVQPMESLTLKANYNLFWNLQPYVGDWKMGEANKTQGFLGQEVDLQANWDYTEDVSFGLLAGWFIPGEVFNATTSDIAAGTSAGKKACVATDLVGTVKVSF